MGEADILRSLLKEDSALSSPCYIQNYGAAYLGESLEMLRNIKSNCINLILTSPPFDFPNPYFHTLP